MHAYASRSNADEDGRAGIRAPAGTSPLRRVLQSALALLLAIAAPLAHAGIGDMDPGYGVNGRFEARRYGQFFVYPPLADGRVLYPAAGGYRRTDLNGLPDETFGSGGVQAWPKGYGAFGTGIWARAGDGRLFVALVGAGNEEYAVLKLGPDGTPDPAFGEGGVAAIDLFPLGGNVNLSAFVVQPDGKLLLMFGYYNPAKGFVIDGLRLIRLLPDGRHDIAFGDGGVSAVPTGPPVDDEVGFGLALLADGRIGVSAFANPVTWLTQSGIVGAEPPDGQQWTIAALLPGGALALKRTSGAYQLAKVRPDGSFDTSFGPNGDGKVSLPSEWDYLHSVAVSPDGRFIFVSGARNTGGGWSVGRLIGDGRSAGQPDTGFGDQGTVVLKLAPFGTVHGLADGGVIITTADYAYRLLGRDAPSPGITVVTRKPAFPFPVESDGAAVVIVSRLAGSDGAIRLRYRTLAESELPEQLGVKFATPGVDFDAVDGVLDWSDGDDGDKVISIPLRKDQDQEGTEQIYVRFEALSPGSWTFPEQISVPVSDPPSSQAPSDGQGSGGGSASGGVKSSGGGSFGWPGLLLMLAALVELRRQRRRAVQHASMQRS